MIRKHFLLITFWNEPKVIVWHTVKWIQVLLCINNNSIKYQSFVYTQLNDHTIQCSVSNLFSLMLNDKEFHLTQRCGQSGHGIDCSKGVFCIRQNSSVIGALPSDCSLSYPGFSLRVGVTFLLRCSRCILQPRPTRMKPLWGFKIGL